METTMPFWSRTQAPRIAFLVSPTDLISPSSLSSLAHFSEILGQHGITTELIGENSRTGLTDFDALFIRMTTSVGGIAHRFALHAARHGMPVIDDPSSIVRGSNKIVQTRLINEAGIAGPRTLLVTDEKDLNDAVDVVGLPIVLKIAGGCYCRGVEKAATRTEARAIAKRLLGFGNPILAQEFLPTSFDWRIGVLDGVPLFACRYHMVPGHWQIVGRDPRGSLVNGPVEPVSLQRVEPGILDLAIAAAAAIGRGFYGVDIKETPRGAVVIEVNDNPDMDVDAETPANPEAWTVLALWFATAIAGRRARPAIAASA